MRNSGRYRLFATGSLGKGDFNVWRMFCELALAATRVGGFTSQLVPENFYNGSNAAAIRSEIFTNFSLHSLISLKNTSKIWFSAVHAQTNFALYVAEKGAVTNEIPMAFGIDTTDKLLALRNGFPIELPIALISEFSPDALAITGISHPADIKIIRKIYSCLPKFGADMPGTPVPQYMREIDMGNDREDFGNEPDGIPLYQGSMVTFFDHRAQAYVSGHGRRTTWRELPFGDPDKSIAPQWRLPEASLPVKLSNRWRTYRIGFCDIANPLNQRTLIAALIPADVVCGHKVPTITFKPESPCLSLLWLAVVNSIAIDYIARKKITLTASFTVIDSLPLPRSFKGTALENAIARRALLLSVTGPEMAAFWRSTAPMLGFNPDRDAPIEDPAQREQLRIELEVLIARDLFGPTLDEMRYLLDPRDILGPECDFETFGALQRAERRTYNEFRTRRLVLEAWDRLSSAQITEQSIQSHTGVIRTQSLPDAAWSRPMPSGRGDVGAMLAALLKSMDGPLPARQVRLAATLALAPRLLLTFLDPEPAAQWLRLIGPEARPLRRRPKSIESRNAPRSKILLREIPARRNHA